MYKTVNYIIIILSITFPKDFLERLRVRVGNCRNILTMSKVDDAAVLHCDLYVGDKQSAVL